MSAGGSYVEAALSSIGVSSEQLVCNVAERLRDDIKSVKLIPWPPRVEELEEEEEVSPLMVKLLSSLWGKKVGGLSPSTLSNLPHHTVCHKATNHYCHQCNHHPSWDDPQQGACRFLLQAGQGDQLLKCASPACDVWTMHDLERCSVCPDEIAEEKPSFSIIDNDDFLNDTLTEGGTAHHCNCSMYSIRELGVQEHEVNIQDEHARVKDAKTVSRALTEKASEMQEVTPYRTMKCGEPPIRPKPVTLSSSTEPQRKRSVIHALTRADLKGDRPMLA